VVATIHDICYEFFPRFFSRSEVIQYRAGIRWTARHARRVITISDNSKRDIVTTYGVSPEKVDVTYLGVDLRRFNPSVAPNTLDATLAKYGITKPYLLAVGNLQPRKNLVRLIDAFVHLKRKRSDLPHSLVLVGKATFRHDDVFKRVRDHGLDSRVIFTGYVPDEDLAALYVGADVFVYPSLYEGFGLPVAEAMACGTPVLTSNRSSMPEVARDGAVLVDPEAARSITDGLLKILTNARFAATLSRRGVLRAQGFTWERTARATLAAFEAAAKGRG
jgi:glycosyltransferase involved in cell wall biosynthesis